MEAATDPITNTTSPEMTTHEFERTNNPSFHTLRTDNSSMLVPMGVICALIVCGNGCVVLLNMRKRMLNRSTRMHVGLLAACDMGFAVTMYAWQFLLYFNVEVRILLTIILNSCYHKLLLIYNFHKDLSRILVLFDSCLFS